MQDVKGGITHLGRIRGIAADARHHLGRVGAFDRQGKARGVMQEADRSPP